MWLTCGATVSKHEGRGAGWRQREGGRRGKGTTVANKQGSVAEKGRGKFGENIRDL